MTNEQRLIQQEKLTELADKYLDEALAEHEPFTEALTDWAINKARQELGV